MPAPDLTDADSSRLPPVLPDVRNWAVAWTVVHGERALEDYFAKFNVASYLPKVSRRRVYSGRAKIWDVPLFPGYVFFDCDALDRPRVFASRKVADILLPPDQTQLKRELSQLACAIDHDSSLREAQFGVSGRPVVVKRGILAGLSGELVRAGSQCRLVVRINFLRIAAELTIDEAFVEPDLA